MQIEGKIKLVNATQVVSEKFSKRTLVVVTSDTYPQEIEVQFTQDKCSLLDGLPVGAEVTIGVNLRGRMWTNPQGEDKYFNTIEGWKIDKVGFQQSAPSVSTTNDNDLGMPF
jgi:hypothetical protein